VFKGSCLVALSVLYCRKLARAQALEAEIDTKRAVDGSRSSQNRSAV
jgi:hypothetical protein